MKKLIIQALKFFCVSGVGWIIDFSIYSLLTYIFDFNVLLANMISSIPAVTYVFFISTKRIFSKKESKISIKAKYAIYLIYQLVLVIAVSSLGQLLYSSLIDIVTNWEINFITNNFKIIIKICITPITMILNFIIMKILAEKI